MKKLVIGILAVIGSLAILAAIAAAGIGLISVLGQQRLPGSVILEADFEAGIVEALPDDPLAKFLNEGTLEVQDVVDALDRGAGDRRVKAFVARIGAGGMGLAHIQEIRDAVARFRAAGKPAIAFAETFGEFGPGNGGYYLATAFDEIHLQPSGDIGLTGLMYESPFVRGLLDKLGVTPRMDQRHEYKNAMNFFTERRYNEPHREAMQALLDSQFGQMVRGVGEARGLTEQQVRERFDRGPYLGQEAVEAGLVDGLGYRDEIYEKVREKAAGTAELLYLGKYLERAGHPHNRGETIALIHGYGTVARGKSSYSAFDGSVVMGSDTLTAAFRAAVKDKRVKAIVFRVDSPGGSYVASDSIWRETVRAREAGKPVVVSMGNLAGSGGYFVAMDADKIVAEPGTITASIGVLGGKMLTSGFWDKLGISWDDVHAGARATMWTGTHDYDAEAYARFQASLDRIYTDFTSKVAAGRELPVERVHEVARGRIWSGEDAKALGLVDEMGGLDVAIRLAREAAGIAADAEIRLKRFPASRSPFEVLFAGGPDNSERIAMGEALRGAFKLLQPQARLVRQLGLTQDSGALSMPESLGPR